MMLMPPPRLMMMLPVDTPCLIRLMLIAATPALPLPDAVLPLPDAAADASLMIRHYYLMPLMIRRFSPLFSLRFRRHADALMLPH